MNKKKIAAVLLCLTMVVCLFSGCIKVEKAGTVDGQDVSLGEFNLYYIGKLATIINENELTTYDELSALKIDGEPAIEKATDDAFAAIAKNKASSELFTELGYTFDADAESTVTSYINSIMESSGGQESFLQILDDYNMSEDDFFNVQKAYYINQMVETAIYGTDGTQPVSESDAKARFIDEYVRVKHILISTIDLSTYEAYDDAKVDEQTQKAQEIYDKVMAGEELENFMDENEDPGMTSNPDGYVFGPNASYVTSFKDAAFDMTVGEVRLVQSDYGWHIMKKYDVTSDDSYFEGVKDEVLTEIADERFDELLSSKVTDVVITKDQNKIDSIDWATLLFGSTEG